MSIIVAFISGMLFYSCVLPLVDALVEVLTTIKSAYVSKLAVTINEYNLAITKAQAEADMTPVHAIGFQVPSEEDYYDECEDKARRKIGF